MRAGLFHDERGAVSSKRVVGVASAATLIIVALGQMALPAVFHWLDHEHPPAVTVQESVIAALAAVVIGVFATTSADKFSASGKVDAEIHKMRATGQIPAVPDTEG